MTKTQPEQKLDSGNRNILELRISCAQLKITRIHDSEFQTNAKVWSNLISNLESKAKVIMCGRIWYGGLILAVGNKIPNSNTKVPKFSQISPLIQWHNYAHFWYSKVDLDWIGTCSKKNSTIREGSA
jgi:hypothetical protein